MRGPWRLGTEQLGQFSLAGLLSSDAPYEVTRKGGWLRATAPAPLAAHGWKIHVSAVPANATDVLSRVVPLIAAQGLSFKLAQSLQVLARLNSGEEGASQVGKFITVYTGSAAQAQAIGANLHDATAGLSGPVVPSDRPFAPDSLVHFRYGSFSTGHSRSLIGERLPLMIGPNGERHFDRRLMFFAPPPPWAENDFPPIEPPAPKSPLLGEGRYALLECLHRNPRFTTFLAIDCHAPMRCVVKMSHAGARAVADACGITPAARLANETQLLRVLDGSGVAPRLVESFHEGGAAYLVTEDLGDDCVARSCSYHFRAQGDSHPETIMRSCIELADVIGALHDRGVFHGDVKPTNLIRDDDGNFRLIDFEMGASSDSSEGTIAGFGTRGYRDPLRPRLRIADVQDDVHALGCLFILIATGVDVSTSIWPAEQLANLLPVLNPAAPAGLTDIIRRCVSTMGNRYLSVNLVRDELARCTIAGNASEDFSAAPGPSDGVVTALELLSHELRRSAVEACRAKAPPPSLDLGDGLAGLLLGLCYLYEHAEDEPVEDALAELGSFILEMDEREADSLPGLHVGRAGHALALLRCGSLLNDSRMVSHAIGMAIAAGRSPQENPDQYHGTAGRITTLLRFWHATGDEMFKTRARELGEELLGTATCSPDGGGLCWSIPDGFGGLSGKSYYGMAHGAAGIGMSFVDLFAVVPDERFRDAYLRARTFVRQGARRIDGGRGLDFSVAVTEQELLGPFWCHGAAGVLKFLIACADSEKEDDASSEIAMTAHTLAAWSRHSGPCLCHGLAGSADALLDAERYLGRDAGITPIVRLLCHAAPRLVSSVANWSTGAADRVGFMTGYAGVAAVLARVQFRRGGSVIP